MIWHRKRYLSWEGYLHRIALIEWLAFLSGTAESSIKNITKRGAV